MTNQLRNRDRNQPGHPTHFAGYDHSDPDFDLDLVATDAAGQVAASAVLAAKVLRSRATLAETGALTPAEGGMDIDRIDHTTIAGYDEAAAHAVDLGMALPFDDREKLMLANHPTTATETLHALASEFEVSWLVLNGVASNPNASAESLRIASQFNDTGVRSRVAAHFNTPEGVLATLAGDDKRDVRATVAANEMTPTSILEQLAYDTDPQVQLAIAHRTNVDDAVLSRLADSTSFLAVREAVQSHPLAG